MVTKALHNNADPLKIPHLMNYRFHIILVVVFASLQVLGAVETRQGSDDERVRSLQVYSVTDNMSTGIPMTVLDAPSEIVIEFDMLEDERRYLRYEIFHCNADWQPSRLAYLEYLTGFNEGTIDDYEFSEATTVAYVHYRLVLPNEQVGFRISGNYMVRVYDEENPDETLLRARFKVSEQTAPVSVFVTSRTDIDYNREHQQLEIQVDCSRAPASTDLFSDMLVTVTPNGRTDEMHVLQHPLRISGRRMIFEHQPELIFDAGNEYRRFETVALTWTPMSVDRVEYHAPYYNHYLEVDYPRSSTSYLYDQTLRGGYVVREYNSERSDIGADYTVVHFSLEMPELFGTDIFIDSDVFGRRLGPESRMDYNRATGRYEKAVLLKQGAYSYQYLALPSGTEKATAATVEGNKYQTSNQYTIDVYTRVPGERYDRLISHYTIYN